MQKQAKGHNTSSTAMTRKFSEAKVSLYGLLLDCKKQNVTEIGSQKFMVSLTW